MSSQDEQAIRNDPGQWHVSSSVIRADSFRKQDTSIPVLMSGTTTEMSSSSPKIRDSKSTGQRLGMKYGGSYGCVFVRLSELEDAFVGYIPEH